MESKQTFGQYIRDRRRALGLTQREFAETLYVTESAVSKWERGLSLPDIALLQPLAELLEHLDKVLEAPQVDSRLRFVKDGNPRLSCHKHGYFNAFQFTAGKACVDFSVYIISRTQSHFGKHGADFRHCCFPAGRDGKDILHRDSLESDRLLERKADSQFRPLRDGFICNVNAVQKNLSFRRCQDAGHNLCQRRFTAAVGPCDGHKAILYRQIDIPKNFYLFSAVLGLKRYIFKLQHLKPPFISCTANPLFLEVP